MTLYVRQSDWMPHGALPESLTCIFVPSKNSHNDIKSQRRRKSCKSQSVDDIIFWCEVRVVVRWGKGEGDDFLFCLMFPVGLEMLVMLPFHFSELWQCSGSILSLSHTVLTVSQCSHSLPISQVKIVTQSLLTNLIKTRRTREGTGETNIAFKVWTFHSIDRYYNLTLSFKFSQSNFSIDKSYLYMLSVFMINSSMISPISMLLTSSEPRLEM